MDMAQLQEIWEAKLEPVYPYRKAGPTVETHQRQADGPCRTQDRRGKAEGHHHPGLPGHQLRVRHRPRLCPRRVPTRKFWWCAT